MNIPVLIVAFATLLALIAHIIGGTAETASIKPELSEPKKVRSWKQAMCAFQMLTIDLGVVVVFLFVIGLTDIISFERELILFLSALYFLWGVVWLIQLLWLKSQAKTYLILPQWLFWFVCSGILYYGS